MPVKYDMTIDETIEYLEKIAKHQLECAEKLDELGCDSTSTRSTVDYHKQLAEWLRELQRYRFEISECKAILDNPTPDVTENDKKRAMYVLQTFPDVKSDEEGREKKC